MTYLVHFLLLLAAAQTIEPVFIYTDIPHVYLESLICLNYLMLSLHEKIHVQTSDTTLDHSDKPGQIIAPIFRNIHRYMNLSVQFDGILVCYSETAPLKTLKMTGKMYIFAADFIAKQLMLQRSPLLSENKKKKDYS